MGNVSALVAVSDYPSKTSVILYYVHTRNIYYLKHGINVTVLNFSAQREYTIEGVRVIPLSVYELENNHYDLLICHAPNLRNHYFFLKKYGKYFSKFVFFFHGHEVLKINKAYCTPYVWTKRSKVKMFIQDRYDDLKLSVWRKYYPSVLTKSTFVFVSHWMLDEFLKWTQIPYELIKTRIAITYNGIGRAFEKAVYNYKSEKKYDFLTVRASLDQSKYSIDIVNKIAKKNPQYRFLLVGKGTYFLHDPIASNIEWRNQTMTHNEIVDCIQQSRCALMPTRTDAQGLMMCEMASTGIPLITSDIPICHEVFDMFSNVAYIDNLNLDFDLKKTLVTLEKKHPYPKNNLYYSENTIQKEVEILEKCVNNGNLQ